jgi:uncharacterized protein YegP (UPF0339 family)
MKRQTSIHLRVKHKAILKARNKYKSVLPKNSVLVGFAKCEHDITWLLYRDSRHDFRWQARAKNGKVIGASSEGYKVRANATYNAWLFGYRTSDWDRIYNDEIVMLSVMDGIKVKSK